MNYEAFKINKESVDKLFQKSDIDKESVDKLFQKSDIDIVGYESPIRIMLGQMRMEQENGIYKVIQEQGIAVDKDELIKALRYDRDQYDKGYVNGYNADKWISVNDRLPEKDGMYLIFSPYTNKEGGIVYCNRFLTKGNPIFPANSFESLSKVTHWMPLPEPPKESEDTE